MSRHHGRGVAAARTHVAPPPRSVAPAQGLMGTSSLCAPISHWRCKRRLGVHSAMAGHGRGARHVASGTAGAPPPATGRKVLPPPEQPRHLASSHACTSAGPATPVPLGLEHPHPPVAQRRGGRRLRRPGPRRSPPPPPPPPRSCSLWRSGCCCGLCDCAPPAGTGQVAPLARLGTAALKRRDPAAD